MSYNIIVYIYRIGLIAFNVRARAVDVMFIFCHGHNAYSTHEFYLKYVDNTNNIL